MNPTERNAEGAGLNDTTLMQQALGCRRHGQWWAAHFDAEAHRLDVEIDFAPGSRFACPTCGAADCPPTTPSG